MTTPLPSPNGLSQQIYDTLGDYLRRDPAALHPEDSLRDDLGLDSLQTIELVYQVESVFDLQIPDEDFGRLRTIGDVLTYLLERTSSITKKPGTNSTIKVKPRSRSKTSPP
jgi:acyl carrier protein